MSFFKTKYLGLSVDLNGVASSTSFETKSHAFIQSSLNIPSEVPKYVPDLKVGFGDTVVNQMERFPDFMEFILGWDLLW